MTTEQAAEERMTLAERILAHLEKLPESYQAEVLDFVEFLEGKSTGLESDNDEREAWSHFSLSQALRGMEDEPGYSEEDILERL
jgi:hypothetical protein